MRRREFIVFVVGSAALAWPPVAHAQRADRVRRVAVLIPFDDESDPQVRLLWPAFTQRLRDLGWSEGRNIQLKVSFATQNIERIRTSAAELVATEPELIVVWSNPAAAVLKRTTQTIPTVFAQVSDPVGEGIVDSLARPGGNITGFQNFEPAIGGKWLELLREISPRLRRVAVLYNQNIAANVAFLRTAEAASAAMDIRITPVALHEPAGLEPAIAEFAQEPDGGLIVTPNPLITRNPKLIVDLAARLQLPAVYPFRAFVLSGGLVSYGFDVVEQQQGAAAYVDRILKGEKPADLPVQAPTRYQLAINLKTAQRLGLEISPQMQQRADEVIE